MKILMAGFMVAQAEEVIVPVDPVIAILPESCEWTVTITQKNAPAAPAAGAPGGIPMVEKDPIKRLTFIKVSKWGADRHLIHRWSDGTESENWVKGVYILFNTSKKSDVYIFNTKQLVGLGDLGEMLVDYQKNEFPELSWVQSSCFEKIESINGKKCFLFRHEEAASESPRLGIGASSVKKAKRAWVDIETAHPLRLEVNEETRDYLFQKNPPPLETLSESFQKEFDRYLAELTPPKIKKP